MKMEVAKIGVESFTTTATEPVDSRPTLRCETVGCLPETLEGCLPYSAACTNPPNCLAEG